GGGVEVAEGGQLDALTGAADVVDQGRGRGRGHAGAQDGEGAVEGLGAPRAARVVEGQGEVALGGGAQAALDGLPGDEQVGERDGREVDAERGAEPGRRRQRRGDAGDDLDLGAAGAVPAEVVEDVEDQPGHAV